MNAPTDLMRVPPLPEPLMPESVADFSPLPEDDTDAPIFRPRSVKCGCYLVAFKPTGSPFVVYDGTMRVECHSAGRTASGDLYQRKTIFGGHPPRIMLGKPPNPAKGIPILPRDRYRYYLRITQILEGTIIGNSFVLGFEMWRFTKNPGGWSSGGTWTNEGAFTAKMKWMPAPFGYPSKRNYLEGDVKNAGGTIVGRLTMGWVSGYLRKATVEVDRVNASEAPMNNGAGVDWKAVGDGIGWQLAAVESQTNLTEPSGEFWSNAECHAEMLARRDQSNLDVEWRYHILGIRRLDATERGIMYDNGATDSNNVPREGCACSTHWIIPDEDEWGLARNQRFGSVSAAYFRTAVHECGHAMGLYHNTVDFGFMNTTDVIAAGGTPATPFPTNIQWSFAADDEMRLKHMPDIYVRPGGTPFGTAYASTPISPADMVAEAEGLRLEVTPLLTSVPIGAPVRVDVKLTNVSYEPMTVPASLSLKDGFVKGQVTGPTGDVRTFSPLVLCLEDEQMTVLQPGESIGDSLTLLRGGQGALFPTAGPHRVMVQAFWDMEEMQVMVSGSADIMVTPAENDAHAKAALKVLTTPDTLLTLVFGGDHLDQGIAAVKSALDNGVLRPHFAFVEAKRLAERFGKRKPKMKEVSDLLSEDAVMSSAEIKKAAKLVQAAGNDGAAKTIAKSLKTKSKDMSMSHDIKAMVDAL
jgi:hypothetical protein